MTEKEQIIFEKFDKYIFENNVSEELLLRIFNITSDYLNMKSIPQIAQERGCSPQNIYQNYKRKKHIKKFGIILLYDMD